MLGTQFIGNLKNIKDCFVPILLPALSFSSPAGPMVLHSPVMTRGQRMSQPAAYMGHNHPEPWAETLHGNHILKQMVSEMKQNISCIH